VEAKREMTGTQVWNQIRLAKGRQKKGGTEGGTIGIVVVSGSLKERDCHHRVMEGEIREESDDHVTLGGTRDMAL